MTLIEDTYPQAWEPLTDAERRTVAELSPGRSLRPEIVAKLVAHSAAFHTQWIDSDDKGAWTITSRFRDYVRQRLESE